MRVKMLEDAPGSPDGVTVNEYSKDQVYEVTEALGEAFLAHELAEAVEDAPDAEPVIEPAPVTVIPTEATKLGDGPQENK